MSLRKTKVVKTTGSFKKLKLHIAAMSREELELKLLDIYKGLDSILIGELTGKETAIFYDLRSEGLADTNDYLEVIIEKR